MREQQPWRNWYNPTSKVDKPQLEGLSQKQLTNESNIERSGMGILNENLDVMNNDVKKWALIYRDMEPFIRRALDF